MAMDFANVAAKRRFDANHRPVEFRKGDQVFLRLYHGYYLPDRPSRKFSQQRSGPWTMVRKVGRTAYELDFLPSMGIHPVISVEHLTLSLCKKDPFGRDLPPPGPVEDEQENSGLEDGDSYEVESVVKYELVRGGYKYLIK